MKDKSWSKFLKVAAVFLVLVIVYIIIEYILIKFFSASFGGASVIGIILSMTNMLLTGFAAGIGFYLARKFFEN